MTFLLDAVRFFLHVDQHLSAVIQRYDTWTYAILAVVVFCETGLVVTPFLPGDSLLFAAGAFAAKGDLSLGILFVLLSVVAILGDSLNYKIGATMGTAAFDRPDSRVFKKEYLDRTKAFFTRYGGKTIVMARFVPIVRTFAPFVAGVGAMDYRRFLMWNVVGGILWVGICLSAGYFFGNLPFVKDNFSVVILAIIFVSVLPVAIEAIRHRRASST
jgi:membrane-associated protein